MLGAAGRGGGPHLRRLKVVSDSGPVFHGSFCMPPWAIAKLFLLDSREAGEEGSEEWIDIFGDEVMTAVLIDRLVR